MPFFYSAFGLSIRTNLPIPGLIPRLVASSTDIQIWLDAVPGAPTAGDLPDDLWYVSAGSEPAAPALRAWRLAGGAYFRLRYNDGTEFLVDRDGTEVWATWPAPSTLQDTATYLLGPVLGLVLRLRGVTCLHASAVALGDRAIALMGPPGAGKSTTAAAFGLMDKAVLADDIIALSERNGVPYVEPAYPQLRLWPDSVAMLYGSPEALPRLTPTWDKRGLDLVRHGCRFETRPLPLAAVYVLAERSNGSEPLIQSVQGRANLLTMLGNTYVSYLLDDAMRGLEFEALGRLVSSVPVRRVTPPADLAALSQLCAVILDDCEALGCTA